MRLFDQFAFYNKLIDQTFSDIKRFFAIYILIIVAFANLIYIINIKRIKGRDERIYDKYTDNDVVNSFINLYMIGLGEFSYDNYAETEKDHDRALIWITFLAATSIINIVFLNMVIAIMGDTFDKVTDMGREAIELQEKIAILSDYIWAVKVFSYITE